MSTRFCPPSVQNQAPEANALIHEVEWTRLFGLADVQNTGGGGEVIALYLRRLLLSRLLLRVFTSTSFAPIQRMFSFAFPTLIHVLKRAKKLNESFSF